MSEDRGDRRREQGVGLDLRGNELLRLDDPSSIWVVESGTVGLFGVTVERGEPGGARRFFFSLEPGEVLAGIPPVREDGRATLVAVALESLSLRRVDPGDASAQEAVGRWEGRWRDHLGDDAPEPGAGFNAALLQRIEEILARERAGHLERFMERERSSREMTRRAVDRLTSILEGERASLPRGTDLFVAAHVVAQAQGIRLRRPPPWQEKAAFKNPVEMIAAVSHVRTRQVLLHHGWWEQDCGPLLAFRGKERNPVALLPMAPGRYEILDPLTRARGPVEESVASSLDPQAYTFYRPLPENATSGLELVKFALRGRFRDLLALLLTGAAATLLGMFTPQAMALLVDRAIPDSDRTLLWQIGVGLAAAAGGIAAFRFAQGIAMIRVETGADTATQSAVWDRLLKLQLSFFRRFTTGDLESRVTAISQIRAYLSGTTLRTLFSSVILLLNLGLLLYYSPKLTFVAVAVALLSGAITVGSGTMILRCYRQILELKGRFFGFMVQLIHGVAKLRVAAAEERAFSRWARIYSRLIRLEFRQRKIQDTVQVLNLTVSSLSTIVLFAVAASLVERGGSGGSGLTTGVFLAFNVAYGTFIGAIVSLSNTVTDVMAIAILRERARPILEAVPEVDEHKADPGRLEGRVEVAGVVFRYRSNGPVILDGVSLRADPGQFIALVGPSGSGKSTLFRLLLGFESPLSGSIFLDGQDLVGLDVHAVRRQLGVVLQNGRINAGSLFENIVCGTRVPLNDAWESARATGFADEIRAMPMGMHTMISEGGTNLSGGQRQRLLLTRALVHRPRVLLLDEATSALDNQTQAVVTESLARLDVTRIVVAHRLSTIRQADRIYVVESGRIAQEGAFDELAAAEGLFARLMSRQMT